MSDSVFHFKQFTIHQDRSAMKVGTDAVLLGSWVSPPATGRFLDIGTGCGILALMLAQRSKASIDAIDIDEGSCSQARDNVVASPWPEQIHIFHESLQNYVNAPHEKYDLIVSNPPYFVDAPKPSEEARSTARHTDHTLSFEELANALPLLLKPDGAFYVILPYKEGNDFREIATEKGLHCLEVLKVRTVSGKQVKRLMMRFSLSEGPFNEGELSIQLANGKYTQQYKELTKDYYLSLKEYRN